MNSKIQEIDPNVRYSASHVVVKGWTFWKTVISFTKFLNSERGEQIYKPIKFMLGKSNRYRIMGSNIIEALEAEERGDLKLNK